MILYLDTSALIKLYVLEDGADSVRDAVKRASVVAASRVSYVEARAALARAWRESRIGKQDLRHAVTGLNEDWERFLVLEVTSDLARRAGNLAEKCGLRAYDALQLASALILKGSIGAEVSFLSFDENLSRAAKSAGLNIPQPGKMPDGQ
jgi:predicted nucleic acid-binding protein